MRHVLSMIILSLVAQPGLAENAAHSNRDEAAKVRAGMDKTGWERPNGVMQSGLTGDTAGLKSRFHPRKPFVRKDMVAHQASYSLAATQNSDTETCVQNISFERHYFAAQTRGVGVRATGWLEPGEALCIPNNTGQSATVSVFEAEDALEGCSRLMTTGTETLVKYADFDRCAWGSHGS